MFLSIFKYNFMNKFYINFIKFLYFRNCCFNKMISKTKIFLIIFLLLNGCMQLPGIDEDPKRQKFKKKTSGEYSINDVEINIINLNKATDNLLEFYNKRKIQMLDYKIKDFDNIYNYNYQYVLGTSDVISIDLTDSDDIDGSYILDTEGMIDLPFKPKNLNNLSIIKDTLAMYPVSSKNAINANKNAI